MPSIRAPRDPNCEKCSRAAHRSLDFLDTGGILSFVFFAPGRGEVRTGKRPSPLRTSPVTSGQRQEPQQEMSFKSVFLYRRIIADAQFESGIGGQDIDSRFDVVGARGGSARMRGEDIGVDGFALLELRSDSA